MESKDAGFRDDRFASFDYARENQRASLRMLRFG
jgi:hypothetical protein